MSQHPDDQLVFMSREHADLHAELLVMCEALVVHKAAIVPPATMDQLRRVVNKLHLLTSHEGSSCPIPDPPTTAGGSDAGDDPRSRPGSIPRTCSGSSSSTESGG